MLTPSYHTHNQPHTRNPCTLPPLPPPIIKTLPLGTVCFSSKVTCTANPLSCNYRIHECTPPAPKPPGPRTSPGPKTPLARYPLQVSEDQLEEDVATAVGLDPWVLAEEEEALLADVEAQRPGQAPVGRPQYLKVWGGRRGEEGAGAGGEAAVPQGMGGEEGGGGGRRRWGGRSTSRCRGGWGRGGRRGVAIHGMVCIKYEVKCRRPRGGDSR